MRIALAQLNPVVGDVGGNAALILDAMVKAREQSADVMVTSELALIGYPPRDLLQRSGVVEACEQAVQAIAAQTGDLCVLIGHPRNVPQGVRPWRNSVSVCHGGKVIARADKQLLPGYDVFDEDRYFEPGEMSCVFELRGRRCGVLICEDLWRARDVTAVRRYDHEPVRQIAQQGCDVLLSLNASPFVMGKWAQHVQQLRAITRELGLPIVAVNQVGANDDLVFDGRSVSLDRHGTVTTLLPAFDAAIGFVDVDQRVGNQEDAEMAVATAVEPMRELFGALRLGLRDYVQKSGSQTVLLGLSGGIDSALTAAIAASALGPAHVHGIMMPSVYSSTGSIADSMELSRRLGLASCREVRIHELHDALRQAVKPILGGNAEGVTDENLQARLRGVLLMAVSNATGALVLATCNKSEMAVGYSTLYGDMCGALAVLGDVSKTKIYQLATWVNEHYGDCGFNGPPIPEQSLTKPPSAELRPNQTDQDTLPPYEVLDQIVERAIELEEDERTIASATGHEVDFVRRIMLMIDRAQYKRDQAPVVLKVTGRSFGRGRPMPIVQKTSPLNLPMPDRNNLDPAGAEASVRPAVRVPTDH